MEKLNLQGRALLAPAFLYFTGLLLRHKRHAHGTGADVGADGGADLTDAAAGQVKVLVQVVVHRRDQLLVVAINQRVP